MSEPPAGVDPDATRTSLDRHQVLAAGTVIAGRYRVLELLGVGGMGMVYRVHDERLHIDVALKALRPERAPDARVLERFEQELVLARQVTHRNVVRIHDIGQDGPLHFLTMDLVAGRSLKQLLQERGRLPVEEVVPIAADLAAALAAAHAQGVVHRDLKPANVLVDAEGRACITDFGVARSMHNSGLTQAGAVVGTLDYLSPEQARGGEVDGRSDIYALGLILFEMLAGELPFAGESAAEVLAARISGRPRRLAQCGVAAPAWLERVIDRCLAADPAERYPDAAQLQAALAAGRQSWRLPRPKRVLLVAAIATGLLAVAAAAWWYASRRPGAAPPAATVVAVLPLAAQTTGGDGWLSTGLAEILAQDLAESPDLQVVDSLRVFRTIEDLHLDLARLDARSLERLAGLLDAGRFVTGTIRQSGAAMRVELRLLDARLPEPPLATMQGEAAAATGLFALADKLGGELREALAAEPAAPGPAPLSSNDAAMEAYAGALSQLLRGDTAAAVPLLERAVAADPGFVSAQLRLARAYDTLGRDDQALAAARQAVAQGGDRPDRVGYEARALEASLAGRYEQAEQLLSALIERYPLDVEARVSLAEAHGERGQLELARKELKAVVADNPSHPRAWFLLGKYSILAGDYRAAADDYLVRALVIQNRLGNAQGRADAENALGIAQFGLGRLDEARRHYENAIALRREIGDERGVAAATANVARIELQQGRYDPARKTLLEALAIVDRIGDRQTVANLQNEIGSLEERLGHFPQALERYRLALGLLRDLGDERALAECYNNVGFTYYLLGDFDNAGVYAQQAMQLYQKAGNEEGMMFAGQTLGLLALDRGDWSTAEKTLLEVLRRSRDFDDRVTEALALGQLGRVARFQGRFGAALGSYRDGLAALQASEDPRALAELHLFQAELSLQLGQLEQAREQLAEAGRQLPASGSLEQQAEWQRLGALAQLRAGDVAAARRGFAAAAQQVARTGGAIVRLAIGLGAAESALAAGDAQAALRTLTGLQREAQAMGQLPLTLESSRLLAQAELLAGRPARAEATLTTALRLADSHRPYAGRFRLDAQLAAVLRALGRPDEAAARRSAAAAEIERLRQGLDPSQQASFAQLTEVKDIG